MAIDFNQGFGNSDGEFNPMSDPNYETVFDATVTDMGRVDRVRAAVAFTIPVALSTLFNLTGAEVDKVLPDLAAEALSVDNSLFIGTAAAIGSIALSAYQSIRHS